MARKQTLTDRLMAEVIIHGGLPVTRATVHATMTAEGHDRRAVDFFAFRPSAVLGVEPMPLADVWHLLAPSARAETR